MAAADKIVTLLVLMFACCSFYKVSAVNPAHCALKDLQQCRDYLKVGPGPGPFPIHPTLPTKDSECCKKVRQVTEWKELQDCLTKEDKLDYWLSRIQSLPHNCKL
jgi:hypothetical protein